MAYGVLRNTVRFLSIRRSEIVRARKSTIYGVVADIDNYKSFVPFCSRSELDDTKTLGKLGVQLGPASYTWNSQLTFKDDEIIAKNDSSFPLKSMNTSWKFIERKRGLTLVSVEIDFELSPGLGSFEPIMSDFSHRYVTAFKDQAEKLEKSHKKS